jgi:hypothetical protein
VAGPEGLSYFTIRSIHEEGANILPDAASQMLKGPRRGGRRGRSFPNLRSGYRWLDQRLSRFFPQIARGCPHGGRAFRRGKPSMSGWDRTLPAFSFS